MPSNKAKNFASSHYLLIHGIQFPGDVPGQQKAHDGGEVRLLDEEELEVLPVPHNAPARCHGDDGHLGKQWKWDFREIINLQEF